MGFPQFGTLISVGAVLFSSLSDGLIRGPVDKRFQHGHLVHVLLFLIR